MSSPLIHDCQNYVVMEPSKSEKFLTSDETLRWLKKWLDQMKELPKDLQNQPSNESAAQRLLDTACNLEIAPGFTLQWFAVRLDRPNE